jgi:hypothetical protein
MHQIIVSFSLFQYFLLQADFIFFWQIYFMAELVILFSISFTLLIDYLLFDF